MVALSGVAGWVSVIVRTASMSALDVRMFCAAVGAPLVVLFIGLNVVAMLDHRSARIFGGCWAVAMLAAATAIWL